MCKVLLFMSTNKYPDVRVEKCPHGWGRGAGATADEYHLLWGTKNFSLTLLVGDISFNGILST